MREAPAIVIIEALLEAGAKIRATDPAAIDVAKGIFGDRITYMPRNYDTLDGADALIVITEWNEFRYPDFERIKGLLKEPVVFDGRNLYPRKKLEELGYSYYGIGV
jgi:UDPglucose 6-dehydrogenase